MHRYLFSLLILNSQTQASIRPTDKVLSEKSATLTIGDAVKFVESYGYLYVYQGKQYTGPQVREVPFYCYISKLSGYPYLNSYEGYAVKYLRDGKFNQYDIVLGDGDMYPDTITITCTSTIKDQDLTVDQIESAFGNIAFLKLEEYKYPRQ